MSAIVESFNNFPFSANLSVIITLAGVSIYYLGRLSNSARVRKQDRFENYKAGVNFFAFFILIPLTIALEFEQLRQIKIVQSTSTLVVILGLYSASMVARRHINLKGDVSELQSKFEERGEELKSKDTKKKELYEKYSENFEEMVDEIAESYNIATEFTFNKLPLVNNELIQFIFAIFAALPIVGLIKSTSMFQSVLTSVLYIFTLTVMAISHGYNNAGFYDAKITTINEKSLQGRIINIGKDFVDIINEDKGLITLTRENIIFIESKEE